ncbi:hypothetical protein Ais01nite_71470 [Asanoa ishikariensis]|uniref:LPXTG-motif cell wall anchor domain-containing protein n=1 Tax=Asanoa ishikariensis TaxID=137265 RepID=A0A1H3UQ52_9ACTN|nr:hypothetical protein [Asanoa ishikariensis]GIF69112.1 hypothetical protein Ais01nite_71470 [Asanoa ishikariensis]SDZ64171.1 hypothetical protein SAMN05421684_7682 [Asanoa ishikariensis]
MSIKTARRLLAGVAAAGAFVAATAFPAYAAPSLKMDTLDALVAANGYTRGFVAVYGGGDELVGKISILIDSSDLEGATVELDWTSSDWLCDTTTGTQIRCEQDAPEGSFGTSISYAILGKSDAEIGTKSSITLTADVDGTKATAKSVVTIAEASDLRVQQEPLAVKGDPGGVAKSNAPVSNVGESTVARTTMILSPDWHTPYAGDFSNCVNYMDAFTICEFDQPLKPGKSYRLSEDIPYSVSKTARTGAVFPTYADWYVEDDWKVLEPAWGLGDYEPTRGTGEPLRLEEVANTARGPQTDINPYDSFLQIDITVGGNNQVDMAAVGATATGAAGATVTVTPTLKNLGPADLETNFEEPKTPALRITIPEGTTVTDATWDCAPYSAGGTWPPDEDAWGKAGAREYGCMVWDVFAGDSYGYDFRLKIDRVVSDATGTITAKIDGDPNAANDVAQIVINGTGAGGGGGDDDGGLPVTGPQATLIASAGVLLVGAGVAGFIVARRRRTRFVA